MWKPQPQCSHFCGTTGPSPTWCFTLLCFVVVLPTGWNSNASHPAHWNAYDTFVGASLASFADEYTRTKHRT